MTENDLRDDGEHLEQLTRPAPDVRSTSVLGRYLDWLKAERGLDFDAWPALWRWSVDDLEGFWSSIWDFSGVKAHSPYQKVLDSRDMPGAQWFPGATLNYAEHALGLAEDADHTAVIAHSQTRPPVELTFGQLTDQVRRARAGLRRLGVGRGDRVVAYLPNIPETLVAYLATVSLGAVWASCAPEFGAPSVIDRFGQIEPKVLLAVGGYRYGDKDVDRREQASAIAAGLPTLEHVIGVAYGHFAAPAGTDWDRLLDPGVPSTEIEKLAFEAVPFDHPLSVLFTSGTTGQPKPIVHGHGGVLLEHLKNHALHWDLAAGDRLLWFTTTTWMMWNALVSALLVRASIVMIDGNPQFPDLTAQWRLAEETRPTLMGMSSGFVMACRREGLSPGKDFDLSSIRQVGAVGSPLPAEGYRWINEQLGDDVLLNVGSGGTDVCTGLVQGNPLLPVWVGEISGASLGADVRAFDEVGHAVVGELGELVITTPMPSMPVGFWGDPDGSRYRAAYFDTYPGVWRHGDWIRFTDVGSCVITGRSDATLNRGGVRLGTAEFYRVVEEIDGVADSLVIHLEDPAGGMGELLLFVVTSDGGPLTDALRRELNNALRTKLSPRHVPDSIVRVARVPHTRTGKKLELPVKRILRGENPDTVADRDALADAGAIDAFIALSRARAAEGNLQ
ncbi:acetoacetate--CoA ligase [Micromonospora globispora]|uniref:acetoacetate--CoA ligase n=1 Tax=Micromonospora globispora TaxID=1450148 RepID=UPI000D6F4542|nr:acetoacetate--CoA ligase [Micromonospora globispora]PWU55441.1 acetoacetate--CoA ligase [Micromonospora globispora]RQW91840.1 acetoacetate--CoA ligase [Micromonospora globispora]